MKYLKISNKGLLDIRLVYLMGGTTKQNNEYKIGQFGTGLKYTIAFMLRNNIDFKIYIDGKPVKLTTQREIIRETNFDIIYINGDRSSITTNMGPDWKYWMIIRELWCNALDEEQPENSIIEDFELVEPCEGRTEYYIQLVPEIQNIVDKWDTYFIHNKTPLMDHKDFAIYEGGDSLRCYKNGVLIKEITGKKTVFSYDFKKTKLNELREMEWHPSIEICNYIPHFDKKTAETFVETIKGTYEEDLDLCSYWIDKFGEGWEQAIGNAKFCSEKTYEKIIDRAPELAKEAIVIVPTLLYNALSKNFPKISILRASDKLNEFFETYSDKLNDKIKKCVQILESVGYFIDPNLKIITGVFGNKETIAEVNLDEKEVRLNQDLENMADSELIVSLIEENEHYKTGFKDCTRDFQTHFIKLYSNLLLKEVKVLL